MLQREINQMSQNLHWKGRCLSVLLVLLLAGVCMIAGCTQAPSGQTTKGVPVNTSIQTLDPSALVPFVPSAPQGWVNETEPFGYTMNDNNQGISYSAASGSYTYAANNSSTAEVIIQDTGGAKVGFRGLWDNLTASEGTSAYTKSVEVKGNPAWEIYEAPDRYASWISVGDRFMIYIAVNGGSRADFDTLTDSINYQGLAALK